MSYIPAVGLNFAKAAPMSLAGLGGGSSLLSLLGGPAGIAMLLASFGPALFSKLFGGDPQKKLRDEMNRINSPDNRQRLTDQYFRASLGGPAYIGAQNSAFAGSNAMANNLASSFGARGIGTTGTQAVLSSMVPSVLGKTLGDLRMGVQQQAGQQAESDISRQLAALTGTQGPSQTQQLTAGGIEAYLPFLMGILKQRYQGSFVMPGTYTPKYAVN